MTERRDYGTGDGMTVQEMPEIMLPPEVANFFRVSKLTVATWLKKDPPTFPNAFKVGGKWRVPKQDVIDLAHKLYGTTGEENG